MNTPSGSIITKVYSPPDAMFVEDSPIRAGELCLCLDLGEISSAVGVDLEGILGIPLFEESIVQLNADVQEVVVFGVDSPAL